MKVVLLTTETTHHTYFAWKLHERFPLAAIVLETRVPSVPFETFHPFERRRDEYEREVLLGGFSGTIADLAPALRVESVNDAEAPAALQALAPDIILLFGTGRVGRAITEVASVACLNLHGGNTEEYRGLDTHLWTIYHRDFGNLVTTLHHVDLGLDAGPIAFQSPLPIRRGLELHELRAVNTEVCVELATAALAAAERTGAVPARAQRRSGRYYSFMPSVLKEDCCQKFGRYVSRL